jgi:hypothetical protein
MLKDAILDLSTNKGDPRVADSKIEVTGYGFTLFPDLPLEIQELIWEAALSQVEMIEAAVVLLCPGEGSPSQTTILTHEKQSNTVTSCLIACHRSRFVTSSKLKALSPNLLWITCILTRVERGTYL